MNVADERAEVLQSGEPVEILGIALVLFELERCDEAAAAIYPFYTNSKISDIDLTRSIFSYAISFNSFFYVNYRTPHLVIYELSIL